MWADTATPPVRQRLRRARGRDERLEQARRPWPVSGCHWTARRNARVRVLHRLERAVVGPRRRPRSRGGSAPTGGGSWRRLPPRRAAAPAACPARCAPGARRRRRRPGECSVVPDPVGQVLLQRAAGLRPPSPACRGRCPSTGSAGARRRRGERELRARRGRAASSWTRGCGSAPYRLGSTSAPPARISPSRRATSAVARSVVGVRPRREQQRRCRRRRSTCGRSRAAAGPRAGRPRRPTRPARRSR